VEVVEHQIQIAERMVDEAEPDVGAEGPVLGVVLQELDRFLSAL
jgi:hypothetical protein